MINVGDPYPTWYSDKPHSLSIVLAVLPYRGAVPEHFTHVLRLSAPKHGSGWVEMPVNERHFESRFFEALNESRQQAVEKHEREAEAAPKRKKLEVKPRLQLSMDLFGKPALVEVSDAKPLRETTRTREHAQMFMDDVPPPFDATDLFGRGDDATQGQEPDDIDPFAQPDISNMPPDLDAEIYQGDEQEAKRG